MPSSRRFYVILTSTSRRLTQSHVRYLQTSSHLSSGWRSCAAVTCLEPCGKVDIFVHVYFQLLSLWQPNTDHRLCRESVYGSFAEKINKMFDIEYDTEMYDTWMKPVSHSFCFILAFCLSYSLVFILYYLAFNLSRMKKLWNIGLANKSYPDNKELSDPRGRS